MSRGAGAGETLASLAQPIGHTGQSRRPHHVPQGCRPLHARQDFVNRKALKISKCPASAASTMTAGSQTNGGYATQTFR